MAARSSAPCLLVFDVGTSAARAQVFDAAGRLLAEVSHPLRYQMPADASPWGREFDPVALWMLLCEAARAALSAAEVRAVAGIAATAQRHGTVLLDRSGAELYAGPNVDLRGAFEGLRLMNEQGAALHALTGRLPPMMFASARWLWFRAHRPHICAAAAHLLLITDWLTWRLAGRAVAAPSSAVETGFFDVAAGGLRWSSELLASLAMPAEILPEVVPPAATAGSLVPAAAERLGLPAGIPVVVAPPDTPAALLGLGVMAPGQVGVVAGWSAPAVVITAEPVFDPQQALWTGPGPAVETWALEANAGPAGSAHRWACEILAPGADFAAFDALAADAPAGAGGVVALLGPRIADYGNPQLLWGGLVFPQANDLLVTGRAELARAALENIAFGVKANLERAEALAGLRGPEVCLGGGFARSRLFPQILADVLGRPVRVSSGIPATGLGAAMCAAVGAGIYPGLAEASAAMSGASGARRLAPDLTAQAEYEDAYERWLRVYRDLENLSSQLA